MSKYFLLFVIIVSLAGCGEKVEEKKLTAADSLRINLLKQADSIDQVIEINPVTYSALPSKGLKLTTLIEKYGDSTATMILKFNRIDKKNLYRTDTLIVPDTITSFLYYSPFSLSLEGAAEIPKILFISQTLQAFAAYEYGVQVYWGPTSTGRRSKQTPNGLFHTNWKAKETISTINDEWLLKWSFNIDNFDGISIHEYEMPGYPASHSCARLLEQDAKWIYYWAQQWIVTKDEVDVIAWGTPVIIFGNYNYSGRRPWRMLPENPDANRISEDELNKILSPYIDTILERQTHRESVIAFRDSLKNQVGKLKE
jgi:lipoprotein-anchoring transpeptidase ErfK/SrfK